jgi:hypothetical protein
LLESIEEKIGDRRTNEQVAEELGENQFPLVDIFGDLNDATEDGGELRRSDADDYTSEAFYQYLTAEIVTDRGGHILCGTVKSRKRDHDGKPIGSSNPNPLLDSREYLVCFEVGTEETYAANLIAECLYSQIDDDGRRLQVMEEIVDHEKNHSALRDPSCRLRRDKQPVKRTSVPMVGSIHTQETRKDSKEGQVEILVGFTQIRIRTPSEGAFC